ncbi:MAG: 1-deoxy-D-xylulose-5-phosphate reductoisomerase [Duncaniella sp.]|nr:1-deoxy-D-xylulose-5-phosphate reductoisomerase [Duncaniella sp.]MDE7146215.1 1-deoxy-D-xylulose-5-phosphate reductoisomerase [Duncaniella sp.]
MPKNIAILGSTGSIGTQTLDVISQFPERFSARILAAGNNVEMLISQAVKHRPALAIIANESKYGQLRDALAPLGIETAAGAEAMADAMERDDFDTVVTATVGYSGLLPTIRAIRSGKNIALANKETLVVAGELVTKLLSQSESTVIPVDSEHSAIYQCLRGEDNSSVSKLIITASGGPFRTWDRKDIENVTAEQALHHPRWNMGAKITIDSATMLNKAFEIIEARWLFDIEPARIEAVVHPQSIVHSMVEFIDGAVKAQLGIPDMHLPIRYALGDATRLTSAERPLSLTDYATLTFEKPDEGKFPCLTLASRALTEGGNTACIINAANEVAVNAFLHGKISFPAIFETITEALVNIPYISNPTLEDYVASHHATIKWATGKVNR